MHIFINIVKTKGFTDNLKLQDGGNKKTKHAKFFEKQTLLTP